MICVVVLGDIVLMVGAMGTIEKIEECGMTEAQSEAMSLKSAQAETDMNEDISNLHMWY